MATVVILGLLPIGTALGSLFPQFFLDPNSDSSDSMDQLVQLLMASSYIGTAIVVITVMLFKEKPKYAPSKAAEVEKHNFAKSLKECFRNKNLMIGLIAMSCYGGVITSMYAVIQPLLMPFGVGQNAVSDVLAIAVFVGFFMNLCSSMLVAKTGKFKK